jgi:hypothetical protein
MFPGDCVLAEHEVGRRRVDVSEWNDWTSCREVAESGRECVMEW